MKNAIAEIMREFYEEGLPEKIHPRVVEYYEKARNATSIIGMRRVGKTYVAFHRIQELLSDGIPLERIVYINFDDERLRGVSANDLKLIGEIHAAMYPEAAKEKCWYFLDELQDVEGWECLPVGW